MKGGTWDLGPLSDLDVARGADVATCGECEACGAPLLTDGMTAWCSAGRACRGDKVGSFGHYWRDE